MRKQPNKKKIISVTKKWGSDAWKGKNVIKFKNDAEYFVSCPELDNSTL